MADSVVFVAGARGSGKSTFLKQHAGTSPRVIVWDPMREYADAAEACAVPRFADSPVELVEALESDFVVYRPRFASPAAFDHFCHCAYVRGKSLVVVDELAAVTSPSKAPGWWGTILRQGRHQGLTVAAATQRPQEIDKTIIGNATRIVCFRLKREGDRRYMAAEMNCDVALLDGLRPLQFIDCDDLAGTMKRGRIVFR